MIRSPSAPARAALSYAPGVLSWFVAVISGCLLASTLKAQCTPDWQSSRGYSGLDGPVYATTLWDPDGPGPLPQVLVVGGSFAAAGNTRASNIALFDGATWNAIGAGLSGDIYALTTFNGQLVAGGILALTPGGPNIAVAAWNGVAWLPMGTGVFDPVTALCVFNGQLVLGTYGSITTNSVYVWSGAAWQPLGGPVIGNLRTMTVSNSDFYVGGNLISAGGVGVRDHGIARWNGSFWSAVGNCPIPDIKSLATIDGELFACGSGQVARWDQLSWTVISNDSFDPCTIAAYNGQAYIGGWYPHSSTGTPGVVVRRWNGSAWQSVASALGNDPYSATIFNLTTFQNQLIGSGLAYQFAGSNADHIARFDGSTWSPLSAGQATSGSSPDIRAMVEVRGNLVAAGWFFGGGPNPPNRVAQWDGNSWLAMGAPFTGGSVNSLASYQGEAIAAGGFPALNGSRSIVRWDGAQWQPLSTGVEGSVSAMTVFEGDLIVTGEFATAGGVSASGVARWNGTSWAAMGPSANSTVRAGTALAVFNGKLAISGAFNFGPQGRTTVAVWDGADWQPLLSGPEWSVSTLVAVGNDLVAAGEYAAASSTIAAAARWNGVSWQTLGDLSGLSPFQLALGELRGRIVLGCYTQSSGSPLLVWDGATWSPLGPSFGSPNSSTRITSITPYHDGLAIGGSFSTIGNSAVGNWAVLSCSCYANCDNSTTPPILNVGDFQCFLNKFAAQDPFANCDGSTRTPVLNANDFQCFLNKFAAGCP